MVQGWNLVEVQIASCCDADASTLDSINGLSAFVHSCGGWAFISMSFKN